MKCTHVSLRPYYFRDKTNKPIKRVLKMKLENSSVKKEFNWNEFFNNNWRVQLELVF